MNTSFTYTVEGLDILQVYENFITWEELEKLGIRGWDKCLEAEEGILSTVCFLSTNQTIHKFELFKDPRKINDPAGEYSFLKDCFNDTWAPDYSKLRNLRLTFTNNLLTVANLFDEKLICLEQSFLGDEEYYPTASEFVNLILLMLDKNVYHGDLKPGNIRKINNEILIFDFDQAISLSNLFKNNRRAFFCLWLVYKEFLRFRKLPFIRFYGVKFTIEVFWGLLFHDVKKN